MRPSSVSDDSEWPLQTVFADRLRFEHELIGHRMAWLMTLNSFVIGGMAVLAASARQFDGTFVLTAAALLLGSLGILSNASCLFSNYWGTRNIHLSGLVLDESWAELPGAMRERHLVKMRLFGRDPRQMRGRGAQPPSQILHPWLLLPTIFLLFFIALPYIGMVISADDRDIAPGWCAFTEVLVVSPFIVLPLLDAHHYGRRGRAVEPGPPEVPAQTESVDGRESSIQSGGLAS